MPGIVVLSWRKDRGRITRNANVAVGIRDFDPGAPKGGIDRFVQIVPDVILPRVDHRREASNEVFHGTPPVLNPILGIHPPVAPRAQSSGEMSCIQAGVAMTRKPGTCVLVGLPPGEFPVPLFDVVAHCITIRGSFVGTRGDMAEALAFAAEGKVKADIELQPLSSINQIFDRLEHGDVPSRVVLDFAPAKTKNQRSEVGQQFVATGAG